MSGHREVKNLVGREVGDELAATTITLYGGTSPARRQRDGATVAAPRRAAPWVSRLGARLSVHELQRSCRPCGASCGGRLDQSPLAHMHFLCSRPLYTATTVCLASNSRASAVAAMIGDLRAAVYAVLMCVCEIVAFIKQGAAADRSGNPAACGYTLHVVQPCCNRWPGRSSHPRKRESNLLTLFGPLGRPTRAPGVLLRHLGGATGGRRRCEGGGEGRCREVKGWRGARCGGTLLHEPSRRAGPAF